MSAPRSPRPVDPGPPVPPPRSGTAAMITPPPGGTAGAHRGRRRRRAAVALVLLALLAGSGLAWRAGRHPEAAPSPAAGAEPGSAGGLERPGATIDVEVEGERPPPGFALGGEAGAGTAAPAPVVIDGRWNRPGTGSGGAGPLGPSPDPVPDPQPDGGGEADAHGDDPSQPEPEPVEPCAGLAPGAHLVTTPDPKRLNPGQLSSSLTIRNCGTDPVDWTAATKPWVTLDAGAGTLAGGATHRLGFSIDGPQRPAGDLAFRVKVSEPGFNQYVDVEAPQGGFVDPGGAAPDPGGTLTTGGPTGCAATCIVSATLQPNATTPTMDLAVETSTAARLAVFVSTGAPVEDADGNPSFPEGGLIAATNDLNTAWHTPLAPLQPTTDYHIVLRATDADGGVEHRVGAFRTITPAVDPGLDEAAPGGPSGCATQCITKAWLTPDEATFDMGLEVRSHTLARFDVFVWTTPPALDPDGRPVLDGEAPMVTSDAYETEWHTTLGPLEPSTTYHVVVRATDGRFRSSHQMGSFETRAGAESMLVAFHRVRVDHDGDDGWMKGELTFSMVVDGDHLATTSEHKLSNGDVLNLSDGDRAPGVDALVPFDDGPGAVLPQLRMIGFERDADGLSEFCSLGQVQTDPGRDAGCDMTWDVASTGIRFASELASMPSCADLGLDAPDLAHARCVEIASPGGGKNVPRFTAVVSFQKVPPA